MCCMAKDSFTTYFAHHARALDIGITPGRSNIRRPAFSNRSTEPVVYKHQSQAAILEPDGAAMSSFRRKVRQMINRRQQKGLQ